MSHLDYVMAKRLQVILQDPDYREIQRIARVRRMSIAEWVRQALRAANGRSPAEMSARSSTRFAPLHATPTPRRILTTCSRTSRAATALEHLPDPGRLEHSDVSDRRASPSQGRCTAIA